MMKTNDDFKEKEWKKTPNLFWYILLNNPDTLKAIELESLDYCISCLAAVPLDPISGGMWNNIPLLAPTQWASPVITEPCVVTDPAASCYTLRAERIQLSSHSAAPREPTVHRSLQTAQQFHREQKFKLNL